MFDEFLSKSRREKFALLSKPLFCVVLLVGFTIALIVFGGLRDAAIDRKSPDGSGWLRMVWRF